MSLREENRLNFYKRLRCDPEEVLSSRNSKIVCTIGPSTQDVDALKKLMTSGMNVVRMNFSHGTHEYHQKTVENARQASGELDLNIAIALDTKGPEIRTGLFPGGEIKLVRGQELFITTDEKMKEHGSEKGFYMDYKPLLETMNEGDRIYIDDGLLGLDVLSIEKDCLRVKVSIPSTISSNKGCNLPNKDLQLPAVSSKDKADLQWARNMGVDMVFASFIRSASQVKDVRSIVGQDILVISKIENQQGLNNIDEIIKESDGIMIARGDLGVEIAPEMVLIAQKMIIAKCNSMGKPVICATQMLDSMTSNPRPTRAEVSDVGNAVIDGADCVMLSGETAKGSFPDVTVNVMSRICAKAQCCTMHNERFEHLSKSRESLSPLSRFAQSIVYSALNYEVRAIILVTDGISLPQQVSRFHPPCPIIVITSSRSTCRRLAIVRSARPIFIESTQLNKEEIQCTIKSYERQLGMIENGTAIYIDDAAKAGDDHRKISFIEL